MRFPRRGLVAILISMAAAAWHDPVAAEQVESLIRLLPAATNGLVIVRVSELLASPRGQREDWRNDAGMFLAGADTIPAWVELIVMGTAFQPGCTGDDWSAAVIPLPANASVESLARHEGIPLQSIGTTPAFYTRRNGYVVQLTPEVAGVLSPALRQHAARWVREVQAARSPSPLSGYLQQAARHRDQIVMALDMLDMMDPDVLQRRLDAIPGLQNSPEPLRRSLRDALLGLQGLTFTANVSNATTARLTIDFAAPPPLPAAELKAVLIQMLADEGAELDDLTSATARVQRNSLILSAQLSDYGLRRIMSFGVTPLPTQPLVAAASDPQLPAESSPASDQVLTATRRYFASVNRVIDDLSPRISLAAQDAVSSWIERDAQRIENLLTRNVDPEMVQFGAEVSSGLRALTASLHGTRVAVNTEQQALTYNVRVDAVPVAGGWRNWSGLRWGLGATMVPFYQTESNLAEVRQRQAEAIRQGEYEREQIWQSILASRTAIRQQMTDRYGEGFDRSRRARSRR